jgi:hypothetical protein
MIAVSAALKKLIPLIAYLIVRGARGLQVNSVVSKVVD